MNTTLTTFSFPTPVLFGEKAAENLPRLLAELSCKKPLIVTDPGLKMAPPFERIQFILNAALGSSVCYSGVHPNPIESDVHETAACYNDHHCDGLIALGGGSALDVGKAARILLSENGVDLTNFHPEINLGRIPPLIAIPTTAGTGSEVGRSSVISLVSTGRKAVLFHPKLLPERVVLDPCLTTGLPPVLTAATGLDALTHCIESYTSPAFQPLCDGIALEGIRLVTRYLPRAFRDGNDLEARGRMLVAASMGAVAFQKDLGAVHSLAHPLSTLCGMHHGTANALCLIAVMKWNANRKPGLYRQIGLACGLDVVGGSDEEADSRTIAYLGEFIASLGLGKKLSEFNVRRDQVDALTDLAVADSCHLTNPVPVTHDDLKALYLECL